MVLVFGYMISDMEANKKLSPILTDLFQREEDSISLVFTWQYYFKVSKTKGLNKSNALFSHKKTSKRKLQQITSNYLSDIELTDFMRNFRDLNSLLPSSQIISPKPASHPLHQVAIYPMSLL